MLIDKFSSYRDGGTISMKCRIGSPIFDFYFKKIGIDRISGAEVEICIDGRFEKCPTIWIGYPGKEHSVLIEDDEVIKYIISKVEDYKKHICYKTDVFINFEQNVRDWKIKNIIDEK